MAQNHARVATVPEYKPLHITAVGTAIPVGIVIGLGTASVPAITAGNGVVVPLTALQMVGIEVGMRLNINGATHEDVKVLAVTPTSFTANFVNSYAVNSYTICSYRPSFIGGLVVNKVGSADTITLYNGSPNLNPQPPGAGPIAVITPATGNFAHLGKLEYGLYYTVAATTAGDYTLYYLDSTIN